VKLTSHKEESGEESDAHSHAAGNGTLAMAGVLGMRGQLIPHFHFQD
jgi:hypothetical protein